MSGGGGEFDPWQLLGAVDAIQLIRRIQRSGNVTMSRHAMTRCGERDLQAADLVSIIRAGQVDEERCERAMRYDT